LAIERINELIKEYLCRGMRVIDIGSGSGNSMRLITDSCRSAAYVVGVDLNLERLLRAKTLLNNRLVDFIPCDAARLPLRDESLGAASMILTLHEVEENSVEDVISEVWRVLRKGATVLFVDKISFKPSRPSEELTLLTEDVYHKALEYVERVKLFGLRRLEEYISVFEERGFTLVVSDVVDGEYVDGEKFLSSWGRDTMRLLERVNDNAKISELRKLISRIRFIGSKFGYGPAKFLVAVLSKEC